MSYGNPFAPLKPIEQKIWKPLGGTSPIAKQDRPVVLPRGASAQESNEVNSANDAVREVWQGFVLASEDTRYGFAQGVHRFLATRGETGSDWQDFWNRQYNRTEEKMQKFYVAHQELAPPPEWEGEALDVLRENPKLLTSPAYLSYVIARNLPFALATTSTALGVGFVTGNPVLGMAAGAAIATPIEFNSLFDDLIEEGATREEAARLASAIAPLIAAVENIGDIPLLKAIAPATFGKLFRSIGVDLSKSVKSKLGAGFAKAGVVTLSETAEELAQTIMHNAAVKVVNEDKDLLDGVANVMVETPLASLPFGVLGGLAEASNFAKQHKMLEVAKELKQLAVEMEPQRLDDNAEAQPPGGEQGATVLANQAPAETIQAQRVEPALTPGQAEQAVNWKAAKETAAAMKSGKIRGEYDLIKSMASILRVPLRKKIPLQLGKGTLGVYLPQQLTAWVSTWRIYTAAHELGHWFDQITEYSATPMAPAAEITWLFNHTRYPTAQLTPQQIRNESIAITAGLWVTDPEALRANAPGMAQFFENHLGNYPNIKDVWSEVQAAYTRFKALPIEQRTAASFKSGSSTNPNRTPRFLNGFGRGIASAADGQYALWEMGQKAKKLGLNIPEELDSFRLASLARGSGSAADMWLLDRPFMWVQRNGHNVTVPVGKSLRAIFRQLTDEELPLFQAFEAYGRILGWHRNPSTQALVTEKVLRSLGSMQDINMTVEQALAEITAGHAQLLQQYPHFEQVARDVVDYQLNLLSFIARLGCLTAEAHGALADGIRNGYVPFFRYIERGGYQQIVTGRKLGNLSPPVYHQSQTPSDEPILPIGESLVRNTRAMIDFAMRTRTAQALAMTTMMHPALRQLMLPDESAPKTLAGSKPFDDILREDHGFRNSELEATKASIRAVLLRKDPTLAGAVLDTMVEDEMRKNVNIFRPIQNTDREGYVRIVGFKTDPVTKKLIWAPGESTWFRTDPDLYKALTYISYQDVSMLMKVLKAPATMLRAGATLSPDFFLFTNLVRDSFGAFVFAKYGFIPVVDTLRGIASVVRQDEWFKRASRTGAVGATMIAMDKSLNATKFDEIMQRDRTAAQSGAAVILHPVQMLQRVSELTEMATRVSVFRKAFEKTGSETIAGYEARDTTIDFVRYGYNQQWRNLSLLAAFYNAGIQGAYKIYREARGNPMRFMFMGLLKITLPALGIYFANMAIAKGQGKDWESIWDSIPQWQKDAYFLFFVGDQIIRVPKPFEMGVLFGSAPERLLDMIRKDNPEVMKDWASNFARNINPFPIPTLALPILENTTNFSFFRERTIVPPALQELPPELQYTVYTSDLAKKFGEMTGWSPLKIENWYQGWTGSLGRYARQITENTLRATGIIDVPPKPTPVLSDYPIASAFIMRNPYGGASQDIADFYDQLSRLTQHEKRLKTYFAENEQEKYVKFKAEHPEVFFQWDVERKDWYSASARFLRGVSYQLAEIRTAQREVIKSPALTPQQKRQIINNLDKLLSTVAKQALSVTKDLTNGYNSAIIDQELKAIRQETASETRIVTK